MYSNKYLWYIGDISCILSLKECRVGRSWGKFYSSNYYNQVSFVNGRMLSYILRFQNEFYMCWKTEVREEFKPMVFGLFLHFSADNQPRSRWQRMGFNLPCNECYPLKQKSFQKTYKNFMREKQLYLDNNSEP